MREGLWGRGFDPAVAPIQIFIISPRRHFTPAGVRCGLSTTLDRIEYCDVITTLARRALAGPYYRTAWRCATSVRQASVAGHLRTDISRQPSIKFTSGVVLCRVFEVGGSNGHVPLHIRQTQTFASFKHNLNTYYFQSAYFAPLAPFSNVPWFSCEILALYKLVLTYLLTLKDRINSPQKCLPVDNAFDYSSV